METRRKIIGILLVFVILAAGAAVVLKLFGGSETMAIDLYFINESGTSIVAEKREIKYDRDELTETVMKALAAGPAEGKNMRVLQKGTSWDITRDQTRLLVDFSQEFLTTEPTRNLLATYAVVKSLCQLSGVSAVKVIVEGGEIITPDNGRIDYLTDKDINLESDPAQGESRTIKLYFAQKDGKLAAELRTVKLADAVSIEKYIVSELIKGPEDKELSAVLSADTQILSAELADGTAYINMSQSFVDKNSGSADKELAAVYSIVNSVSELASVNDVQLLIEGKKVEGFANINISAPLHRNESMMKND